MNSNHGTITCIRKKWSQQSIRTSDTVAKVEVSDAHNCSMQRIRYM
ncbi:hypothetical protein MUK42_36437 [Musa troglodytarum]|uniref:Uncharacterized protein n=1 Tax=Musa troglodytarum TaxID=320322 RepID=A0A9E7EII9_9LILI|nr:hypothetical protein MUK42_36437 [Musa troglodytarum]